MQGLDVRRLVQNNIICYCVLLVCDMLDSSLLACVTLCVNSVVQLIIHVYNIYIEHTNSLQTLTQVAVIAASCCVGPGLWWWCWL